jgi:hypothetical protein
MANRTQKINIAVYLNSILCERFLPSNQVTIDEGTAVFKGQIFKKCNPNKQNGKNMCFWR